ncbi:MAG TPA: MFS transporter [Solirubrobacteraceae bacterium]|nr:MFS transporter [Solirubrobacteraceae bacterium]
MSNLLAQLRVLRHRDFRYLWLAQSASVIGDCIVVVALALFVIQRTGDATDLGLVLAAASLPLVAFLLVGGVWADRLPRHRVMVVTDLVRFTLHALLATLIFTDTIEIWQLIAIEALFGTAEAFFRPAANGLLPQTVPEAEIQQAQGLSSLSNNIGEFAGPALASALVLGLGAGYAFALDAATFLISAGLLSQLRPRRRVLATDAAPARSGPPMPTAATAPAPPASSAIAEPSLSPAAQASRTAPSEAHGVRHEIREGYREVRSRDWVWATLAAFCVALFAGLAPWFVLGPVVAREQYGDIGVYGLVSAVLGIGTIVGSLLGIGWRPRFPMRAAMLAIMVWPAIAILYAAGVTLVLVAPAMLLAGAGIAMFDVWWTTALAERIPPDKLSRVSSYDWMVSLGLLPLGYVLSGPLSNALGSVEVLLGGSALAALAFALGLLPRETRMLKRLSA